MIIRRIVWLAALALPVLLLFNVLAAYAASNSVSKTGLGDIQRSVSADDFKPSACDGLYIDELITGTGAISGTAASDLILGGPGNDTISGEGGDDCILGGGGSDTLIGNGGNDVCIGGPGADNFDATCEDTFQ
jgi:Ca2+-binding RTX toxin-like protein